MIQRGKVKREFYPKFYRRKKDCGMTLETNEEVLNKNKKGLWKKHPREFKNKRTKSHESL